MIMHRKGLSISWPDAHICETGTRQILSALSALVAETQTATRLTLVLLSTTGISTKCRDVPLPIVLPYHFLSTPHNDKRKMEEMVISLGQKRKWVLVRPSFLLDGVAKGRGYVRVGIEDAVGNEVEVLEREYGIWREDVGG